jgi:uncharacterized protein (TIGR03437 family)
MDHSPKKPPSRKASTKIIDGRCTRGFVVRLTRCICCCMALLAVSPLNAQPQIGGGTCTNGSFTGIYHYILQGDLVSGGLIYPYAELGKLVSDGQGRVTGSSHASVSGAISASTITGTYSVQANCTGSMTLSVNAQSPSSLTFQLVNGGQGGIIAFSSSTGVVAGRAYRQTANLASIQCGPASLSGTYGYLLTGIVFNGNTAFYYSQAGTATADGRGGMSATGMANVNGTTLTSTGQGNYSIASDCSGTASVRNQNGTANYYVALVADGQGLLFMESDNGYTVAGEAQPQFSPPQASVVNAASFDSQSLAPGAIFSIFGKNLPLSSSPSNLVLVNGEMVPVFFSNGGQLNAQVPFDVPTDRPVTVTVSNAGAQSNAVSLNVRQAGPGIFTYGSNRAVVQNPDFSVNSSSNPAHVGDIVLVYMTGGGPVSPSLSTGVATPSTTLYRAVGEVSFTIGGVQAETQFFGLTPGFIGLYQANLKVPSLPAGDYTITARMGAASSNTPFITIGR